MVKRVAAAASLVLVGVLALAPASQAGTLASEGYPVTLSATGYGTPSMTFSGGSVTCETTAVSGSTSAATSTVTFHPTFSGCTAFGFIGATVSTTGCDFLVHVGTSLSGGGFEFTWASPTDIVCESGKSIKVSASTCELELKSQNGLKTVHLSNDSTHVRLEFDVQNLAYTVTKDGFLCPLAGTGNFTLGEIEGNWTVKGNNGEVWVE